MATNNSPFTIQEPKRYDNLVNQMNQQANSIQTMSTQSAPKTGWDGGLTAKEKLANAVQQNLASQNKTPAPSTGYGTIDQNKGQQVGYTNKQSEIDRTLGVITERQKAGMDLTNQLSHYKNLTGQDYKVDGGTTKPPGQVDFDYDKIGGMFTDQIGKMQAVYDERMKAMEKMLQDMMNQQKYIQHQGTQVAPTGPEYSGEHVFDSGKTDLKPGDVGYTQKDNAMNDALYRYLNNTWNGGF